MTLLKILLFNGIILKFDWFILNTSAVLIWQVLVCTKVLKGHGDFQKGRGPSFEQTWIPYILCAKFGWKMVQWFWRRRIFKFVNLFTLFRNYLPLGKDGPLHLNKLESPTPKDALVEIGPVVLEKILKICQCISLFRNYLPLEKGGAFHLNKLESTSPIDALCQVWLKFGPAVLEKKSLRQQRRRRTNFDQKSSLEPSFGSCKLKICESSGISCGDLFRLIDIE